VTPEEKPEENQDPNAPRKRSLLRRSAKYLAPIILPRWTILLVAAVALISGTAFQLIKPWPVKFLIDYLDSGVSFLPEWVSIPGVGAIGLVLIGICAIILGEAMLSSTAAYFKATLMNRMGEEVAFEIRMALFSHVQRLGLIFHDSKRMGDIITTVTDDTRAIRELATTYVLEVATSVVTLIAMLTVMLVMDWQLALVGMMMVPLLIPAVVYFRRRIENAAKQRRKRESELTSVTQETLASIRLVKTLGREDHQEQEFGRESSKSAELGQKLARLEVGYVRAVDLLAALGTCAIISWGVYRVQAGQLKTSELYVFIVYVRRLYAPIRGLAKYTAKIAKGTAGLERVIQVFEEEPTVTDAPDAVPLPDPRGHIEFQDVGFRYLSERGVLDGVSFRAEPGQVIALVGHSGAGKSTILSLIPRLYDPSQGRVLVDGHDLRGITIDSLRDQISMVMQDSILLQTSIRENILYGRRSATEEEVLAAAEAAGVTQFIDRMPNGYDTLVGPRGATLSGGERQRVAIARALVRSAPILLLDEPTTGLDASSELLVMQALKHLMRGRTTLLVSHQLNLIEHADRILVLDEGQLVESGTHDELLRTGGVYARLLAAANHPDSETGHPPAPTPHGNPTRTTAP
jgi:ATP-binding cassette subfamily B protein